MQARRITVASLTLVGLCVSFCSQAQAQQVSGAYQPPAADQAPAQAGQPEQYQPYPGQPYPGQPYQPQPYQAQPYPGQPYQPQPYPAQPYPGQPYQPQPYQPQPYYPAQPYPGSQPTYVQPSRTPVRYVNRPRLGLVVGGAVTLGVAWSLTALAAASYSGSLYSYDEYSNTNSINSSGNSFGYASELWPLYIPVLGPWIEMGFLHGSGSQLGGALLAFDGLVQAGGLAMIIAGAVTRTKVAIYAKNNLQINPLTLNGGSGIVVGGRF